MSEGRRAPTFALDANVIIHALTPGTSDEGKRRHAESKPLVRVPFWLPSMVASEVLPFLSADEVAHLGLREMPAVPINFDDVDEATHILREMGRAPERCPTCFVAKGAQTCPSCREKTKSRDIIRDAMIVAACAAETRVDVLYTYNTKHLIPMASHIRTGALTVAPPPNIFGGPLGDTERD